nr:unnamed protein product [Digitaria exilis]
MPAPSGEWIWAPNSGVCCMHTVRGGCSGGRRTPGRLDPLLRRAPAPLGAGRRREGGSPGKVSGRSKEWALHRQLASMLMVQKLKPAVTDVNDLINNVDYIAFLRRSDALAA